MYANCVGQWKPDLDCWTQAGPALGAAQDCVQPVADDSRREATHKQKERIHLGHALQGELPGLLIYLTVSLFMKSATGAPVCLGRV